MLWGFSPLGADPKGDAVKLYRVEATSGFVVARRLFSHVWLPLKKNEILYRDDTLMVGEKSSIRMRSLSGTGTSKNENELTIHRTFVSRIDEHMIRKVKVSVYFDKSFEKAGSTQSGGGALFQEAWNQVMAIRFSEFLGALSGSKDAGISLGVSAKPIAIVAPWDDQVIHVNSFPQNLRLSWKKPSGYKGAYKIHFWNANEARPDSPRDVSEQAYYVVRVEKPGVYNVQVLSENDEWQSKIMTFSVESEKANINKNKNPTSKAVAKVFEGESPEIEALFPPDHFVAVYQDVEFFWKLPFDLRKKSIQLEVKTVGGPPLLFAEKMGRIRANLAPGSYQWRLKIDAMEASSGWRELFIKTGAERQGAPSPLMALWSNKKPAVVEWVLPEVRRR